MNPYLIGLTGGIGSGKSTAAELLARAGAGVIDTDAIAHALTAPGGAAMRSLIGEFGPAIATKNGALDRAAMREMAFADPTVRRRLEAILHPMIHAEVDRQIAALAPTFPYLVLVVPLLIETGTYRERIDRLAVVDCPEALQIARVRARSQLPEATIRAILAAQASREARLAAADDIIDNSTTLSALTAQLEALHQRYLAAAEAKRNQFRQQ
jgi:dephospho-CoA kinase